MRQKRCPKSIMEHVTIFIAARVELGQWHREKSDRGRSNISSLEKRGT